MNTSAPNVQRRPVTSDPSLRFILVLARERGRERDEGLSGDKLNGGSKMGERERETERRKEGRDECATRKLRGSVTDVNDRR